MALPMLKWCSRISAAISVTCRPVCVVLPRLSPRSLPQSHFCVRLSSSDQQSNGERQKVLVVGIPNPFLWFRTRICYFIIRSYFDKDFTVEEFTEGAKQAFTHVSRLLSDCQFDALEGLVATDLLGKLKEKCTLLPPGSLEALSARRQDIMYTTPGDVQIHYDDNGQKFVSILMRFWYLTSARLPEDSDDGTRVFKVAIGGESERDTKRLLTANYDGATWWTHRFQREFTQGVPPAWVITRIEHSRLLD